MGRLASCDAMKRFVLHSLCPATLLFGGYLFDRTSAHSALVNSVLMLSAVFAYVQVILYRDADYCKEIALLAGCQAATALVSIGVNSVRYEGAWLAVGLKDWRSTTLFLLCCCVQINIYHLFNSTKRSRDIQVILCHSRFTRKEIVVCLLASFGACSAFVLAASMAVGFETLRNQWWIKPVVLIIAASAFALTSSRFERK